MSQLFFQEYAVDVFFIDFYVLKIRVFHSWITNVESQKYLTFCSVNVGVEDPKHVLGKRNWVGQELLGVDTAKRKFSVNFCSLPHCMVLEQSLSFFVPQFSCIQTGENNFTSQGSP